MDSEGACFLAEVTWNFIAESAKTCSWIPPFVSWNRETYPIVTLRVSVHGGARVVCVTWDAVSGQSGSWLTKPVSERSW